MKFTASPRRATRYAITRRQALRQLSAVADLDRIRRRDPRAFPTLPVIDVDPDIAPECLPFQGGGAGAALAELADMGVIPAQLDRRREGPDVLRAINRELIRLGGARPRRLKA